MNYRSIAQLAQLVDRHLGDIPATIDLVVGIPRSGLLAANIVALKLNLPLTDLQSFVDGRPVKCGSTRAPGRTQLESSRQARHVLVVDDSVWRGHSIAGARRLIAAAGIDARITYCAPFVAPGVEHVVDLHFESVPFPRVFEWNVMHHPMLGECCVDIDGILCRDPRHEENDDGDGYRGFLSGVAAQLVPSFRIGHLVTSRLEKYRPETEAWLRAARIDYGVLHMLDLPDAKTRRERRMHGSFKASVYRRQADSPLFIESEPHQADEICRLSGKPVLCLPEQRLYEPGVSVQHVTQQTRQLLRRLKHRLGLRRSVAAP
jgi:uncharacterized HAD superfamily protein/adenine/guanine phosphoribosyltransferase-like PRPP-binding protein